MRTIVVADAHGYPDVIGLALEHSGFSRGSDRLIFAGDVIDRGPDQGACISLLEDAGAHVLLGNHDVVALEMATHDPESPGAVLAKRLFGLLGSDPGGRIAVAVHGILITHAGVSERFRRMFEDCQGDMEVFAHRLNEVGRREYEAGPGPTERSDSVVFGPCGPLQFRPLLGSSATRPLSGLTQIAGHTPASGSLADLWAGDGLHLIDPGVAVGGHPANWCRYAVVESGRVEVVSGYTGGCTSRI